VAPVILCRLTDLAAGRSRGFKPAGTAGPAVFLVRRGAHVHGYYDACPHYGDTPMAWRRDEYLDAGGTHIVCAAHGALFEIETGLCILGPCLGDRLAPAAITITAGGDVILHHPSPADRRA
jgi:nitrite reductase/ring-hydroxylating ferredoxin subunit